MSYHKNLREIGSLEFTKWFPNVTTFKVVKKKSNGELRMYVHTGSNEYSSMPDSNVKAMFLWLGRYLAMKGKLPKHIKLAETAVLSGRVKTQLMEVLASEVFDSLNDPTPTNADKGE